MFDNYPPRSSYGGQTNQPTPGAVKSAPEDIFAEFEGKPTTAQPSANYQRPPMPAATQRPVSNGLNSPTPPLRPQAPYSASMPQVGQVPSGQGSGLKYLIIGILTLFVLLGGGFYLYQFVLVPKFSNQTDVKNEAPLTEDNNLNAEATSTVDNLPLDDAMASSTLEATSSLPGLDGTSSTSTLDNQTATTTENLPTDRIVNNQTDTDGDGLSDQVEASLGTNINKIDTDDDGLNDYEEVNIWKSNPVLSDTDGDTYLDGAEVKSGYNPIGPGKIMIKN